MEEGESGGEREWAEGCQGCCGGSSECPVRFVQFFELSACISLLAFGAMKRKQQQQQQQQQIRSARKTVAPDENKVNKQLNESMNLRTHNKQKNKQTSK